MKCFYADMVSAIYTQVWKNVSASPASSGKALFGFDYTPDIGVYAYVRVKCMKLCWCVKKTHPKRKPVAYIWWDIRKSRMDDQIVYSNHQIVDLKGNDKTAASRVGYAIWQIIYDYFMK